MNLKGPQESLKRWTKQNWRTRSRKPSTQGKDATGEVYLPDKQHAKVSSSQYAAGTSKKRKSLAKGEASAKTGLLKGMKA